ncbi:right-handed parallel beta-helix repeat-containing protein, partial [Rhizobium johnstonii]
MLVCVGVDGSTGGYSWSYGIGLGDQGNATNYDISGNYIHDGVWGVSISAAGYPSYARTDIDIYGNVFDDLSSSALKVDRPASGSFHENIIDSAVSTLTMPVAIALQSTFLINDNKTLEQAQAELDATSGDTPSNSETPTTPVVEPPV